MGTPMGIYIYTHPFLPLVVLVDGPTSLLTVARATLNIRRFSQADTLITPPWETENISSLPVGRPTVGLGVNGHSAFEQRQALHCQADLNPFPRISPLQGS